MIFEVRGDFPTVTAQQKQFTKRGGKIIAFDSSRIKNARKWFERHFATHKPKEPFTGAVLLAVKWTYATKDKRKWGKYKITRPDNDNMQKLFQDSLTRCGFWFDDSQVAVLHSEKIWGKEKKILIEVKELKETLDKPNEIE